MPVHNGPAADSKRKQARPRKPSWDLSFPIRKMSCYVATERLLTAPHRQASKDGKKEMAQQRALCRGDHVSMTPMGRWLLRM